MLKQLRSRKLMKNVLRITLILIIPSFIMFYGWSQISKGGRGENRDFEYAKVKSKTSVIPWKWVQINREEMKLAKDQIENEYYSIIASQIQDKNQRPKLDELVSRNDNVNRAIENYVLEDYANKMRIVSPIEEIKSYVEQMFPENTQQYFAKYLEYTRQSEGYFIYTQSELLKLSKARLQVQSRAKVSLFECWLSFLEMSEKLKIASVVVPIKSFTEAVNVDPKELETFFTENIDKYTVPEKINYEYIAITAKSLADTINPTDTEVKEYYEQNKETQFKKPKEVNGRHIMIKCPLQAPAADNVKAKEKIEAIYKEVKEGKDFAKLADKYSEDEANIKKASPIEGADSTDVKEEKQGGKFTPVFEKGFSPYGEDFATTMTLLSEGTLTEPIRSEYGWHIVKVESVKPATYEAFDNVIDRIKAYIKNKKATAALDQKYEEVRNTAKNFTTLSALAKEAGVEVKETGLLKSDEVFLGPDIQSIAENKELIDELGKGDMSEVFKNYNAVYVLSKKEIEPSHKPTLSEVETQVTNDFKAKKAIDLAKAEAEKISKESKTADDLKKIADEKQYKFFKTEEFFTRISPPENFPNIKNFTRATLNTPKDKVILSEVQIQNTENIEGYAVWLLTDKVEPTQDEFVKELPKIQEDLLSVKRETLFREFIRSEKNNYSYKINPEFINQ